MSRADKLEKLGIKAYNEGGLIRALAVMIDAATKKTAFVGKTDKARDLVTRLKTHCTVFAIPSTPNAFRTLQPHVERMSSEDMDTLVQYYAQGKDWSWVKDSVGMGYLCKYIEEDLERARKWADTGDSLKGKIR